MPNEQGLTWRDLRRVVCVQDNLTRGPLRTHYRRVWFTTHEAALAWRAPAPWTLARYAHEPLEGLHKGRKVWIVTMWRRR